MNDRDARWIADAFALGRPLAAMAPEARGEMGRIWRLETDLGRWAIKELFEPVEEAIAQADVAYQLAALEAGLPLPRPIVRPNGEVLGRLPRDGATSILRAYAWVDLSQPVRPVTVGVAGQLLARLHLLDRPAEGPMDPWFSEPLGADRWITLRQAVRAASPPWAEPFERLASEAEAAEAIIDEAQLGQLAHRALRRCHLDFNPENVLIGLTGDPIVLDWENSGSSPYEQELGAAALDFARRPAAVRRFLLAYADADGPARLTGRRSFAMAVAVQSHITEVYARAALSPATDEDRRHYARRMAELARTTYSLERLDRLLDVIGV